MENGEARLDFSNSIPVTSADVKILTRIGSGLDLLGLYFPKQCRKVFNRAGIDLTDKVINDIQYPRELSF